MLYGAGMADITAPTTYATAAAAARPVTTDEFRRLVAADNGVTAYRYGAPRLHAQGITAMGYGAFVTHCGVRDGYMKETFVHYRRFARNGAGDRPTVFEFYRTGDAVIVDDAAAAAAEQQQPARFTPHAYRHRGGLGERSSWRWTATVRHDGEHYETVTIAEAGQPWILDYPTKAAAMAAAEQRCAELEAAADRPAWDVLADADMEDIADTDEACAMFIATREAVVRYS